MREKRERWEVEGGERERENKLTFSCSSWLMAVEAPSPASIYINEYMQHNHVSNKAVKYATFVMSSVLSRFS